MTLPAHGGRPSLPPPRPPPRLAPAVLGPMRLGSLWLVAIRYPVMARYAAAARGAPEAARSLGWSVAYTDLNELIATSRLARLPADIGYDFELSQIEPG